MLNDLYIFFDGRDYYVINSWLIYKNILQLMLRKGLEKLLPNFLNKGKVYRYFSDHHEPVPTRLPKVHEVG